MPDPSTQPPVATAQRLARFGETIFSEISRLALQHNAVNLGQGFPDFDGPEFIKQAAIAAIDRGDNQYAPMPGIPALRETIAECFEAETGQEIDPGSWITVTSGCTEAIAACLVGLTGPGDEVILLEPFYDSYPACLAMTDAVPRFLTLRPPSFEIDLDALRALVTDRTRIILLNTPHNPCGRVYSRAELEAVAALAIEHDLIVIMDEVYDRLVFEGEHVYMASLPGMAERTISLRSLGKTFSLTGWKIGWSIAPPNLTDGIRAAHQFFTYAVSTPLQHGTVAALKAPSAYFEEFVAGYRARRDRLCDALDDVGFTVFRPEGTYFVLADHSNFGFEDDVAFCRHLIEHVGVAAIPPSAFYNDPTEARSLVRFAFCKTDQVLDEAINRLQSLKP
ncbi:MAG: aminotransferase class I/II-fold pyridoxal phosphate-dependent enzyme [Planctomycetota bacterium]|nr:aminotransferase class I/II-fold pyridoxal phosphate-dependent enzyme [Planctomycetota bacterium]